MDNVLGRNILPERKVEIYHTELDDFKTELKRHNFHKHLTNLVDGSIDLALVNFYANLYKFDADSLNTFLETLVVLAEGETFPTYSRYCKCL